MTRFSSRKRERNQAKLGTDTTTTSSTEPVNVTYTSFNALKTLSDGNGHVTRYDYDDRGWLTKIVRPLANESTNADVVRFTSYANDGALLQQINGRGLTSNYAYDTTTGDLTGVSYPAAPGENVSLSYDSWGRPSTLIDQSGTHSVSYNDADAPISTTTTYKKADGTNMPAFTLATLYHADGLRAQLAGLSNTASSGISFAYGYDARGMLTGLTNAQNQTSAWTYKANGWGTSQTTANGWTRSWAQNALGQTKLLSNVSTHGQVNFGGPNASSALLYDGAGNMTRETAFQGTGDAGNGTTTYGYDGNDRVTGEDSTRWSAFTHAYGYDSAYNRTSANGTRAAGTANAQSWTQAVTSNAKNQIASILTNSSQNGQGSLTYGYDDEGNRTGRTSTNANGTGTQTYIYDSNDHLTSVTDQQGSNAPVLKMTAGYRADGLRAWKETPQGRTYFFYDGGTLLAEMDESGALKSVSTWGADGLISKRVSTSTGPVTRYYAFDPRGNVAARTDAAGVVTDKPTSSAYGGSNISGETVSTFGGQVGGYYDEETGLVLFGQRYYDQGTGTWLTRDPIAENGGINLYSYVKGNPVNSFDPDGLDPEEEEREENRLLGPGTAPTSNSAFQGELAAHGEFHGPEEGHGVEGEGTECNGSTRPSGGNPALRRTPYHPDEVEGRINKGIKERWKNGRYIIKNWDKGTFKTRAGSIKYHHEEHGAGTDPLTYTRQGVKLWKNHSGEGQPHPLGNGDWGWKITIRDWFGIFTHDGKIVTHGPRTQ